MATAPSTDSPSTTTTLPSHPASSTKPQTANPLQLSIPLHPSAPHANLHLHLTIQPTSLLLFLSTSTPGSSDSSPGSLRSLVYAMPNRHNPSDPLSTALYTHTSTLDFSTRVAKALARRTGRPVFVGGEVGLAGAMVLGGSVEEEMEVMGRVVGVVVDLVKRREGGS